MTVPNPELKMEIALARAPITRGFPAVTADFLTLLRRFRWDPQGLLLKEPTNHIERLPVWLTPCAFARGGPCIWWVGDSAARATCSPADFAALVKGRALADGSVLAGGSAKRLYRSKGWAELVPRAAAPWEVRRHLITLTNGVLGFLPRLDALMKGAPGMTRVKAVATLCNELEMANDKARYFGLGVDPATDKKKPLNGGA